MNENRSDDSFQLDAEQVSQQLKIRPEIYLKIVNSFAKTLDDKMQMLGQALTANDAETMRSILHELKGTAGNLRLSSIIDKQSDLHLSVKEGHSPDKLKPLYEALKKECLKLQQFLRKRASEP